MYVIAAQGIKVPMEDKPTSYIEGALIRPVEDSAYYLRRISDKDLVEVTAEDYQLQQDALAAADKAAADELAKAQKNIKPSVAVAAEVANGDK